MKRIFSIGVYSLLVFAGLSLFYSVPVLGQDKIKEESNSKISKRIDSLESMVKDQQIQIASLQKEIESLKKENPVLALPQNPQWKTSPDKIPKGARPFKFNGQNYYMIPLSKAQEDLGKSK